MRQGDTVPDVTCQGIDGTWWSLATLVGEKGLVVYFLSATCPYVLAQEERLLSLARHWLPQGVGFVAVCSNSDATLAPGNSFEDIRAHAKKQGYPFPYLYDVDQALATTFGATCTPDIFVLDRELRLHYHGRLDDHWRDATQVTRSFLAEAIEGMVAGRASSDPGVPSFGCAIKWISEPPADASDRFVTSAFLHILDHPGALRIVHVLTGTLIEGEADLLEFLQAFREPATLAEVAERLPLPNVAPEVLKQLAEAGFLVAPGTDELADLRERIRIRRERVGSGSLLSILRLNLTTGCNLRCTYCYMEAPMVNRAKADHAKAMSEEVARGAIDAFMRNAIRNGRRHVSIRYIGGEPLLNPKVLRIAIETAERSCHEQGISVTHLVCTNGLLVDRTFARFLRTLRDAHILISLDGIRERNDKMRVDMNGHGVHDRVVDAIRMLLQEGVPLGIPAVVDRDGLTEVTAFLDELHALGVERVGLNPSYRFDSDEPSEAELQMLVSGFCDARRHAQSHGLELSGKAFLPEWHALNGHLANCEAMGRALVVDPDGSVSLCDKLDETLGHVDDLPSVFLTESYQRFAMRVRGNIESCSECDARWVCNGGCVAEARACNGTDSLSGSRCEFIRLMASRILIPLTSPGKSRIDTVVMSASD